MAIDIKFDVDGLKELDHALHQLGVELGGKALRKAGREAMGGVAFAMARGAEVDQNSSDEHMRDAIKISTKLADSKKGGAANAAVIRVGPSKEHAHKALWQEYGHNIVVKKGKQKQIVGAREANPFMRPALYENHERVVGVFKTQLALEIEKATRKLARQSR